MRKPYGKLILVLAAMALATGGCQKKGNAVETNASTEVTVTESTTAREPVSEETWSWLVQTYKLLEANYEIGQKLVEDGLATQTEDPEEVVAEAKRLLEYGDTMCYKDDMTEEDGQDLLYDMVSASNRLMDLIEKNGGTAITMDEAIGKETEAAPVTEAATEMEGETAAPGAETEQEAPESTPDAAQESAAQPDAVESQTPAEEQ